MPEKRTFTDARGREFLLAEPRRLVSLVPSLTETVIELGLAGRLVGRTRYCIHPAEAVAKIPIYGGTKDPDLDGIIAARPDLVLACVEENRAEHLEALEAAGLAVYAAWPRGLAGLRELLADYGRLFAAEAATRAVLAELDAAEDAAARFREVLMAGRGEAPRAATLIWRKPWMASGSGTYIQAMMTALGLVDAFAGREGYFETDPAELAGMDLDLLFLPDEPYDFGEREAEELAAAGVARGRESLILVQGELLSWYGTRSPRALLALIDILAGHFALLP